MKFNFAKISRVGIAAILCFVAVLYAAGPISGLVMQVSGSLLGGALAVNAFSQLFKKNVQSVIVAISCLFALGALIMAILFLSRGYLGMSGIAVNIIILGSWGTALVCAALNFVFDRKKKGGRTSAN